LLAWAHVDTGEIVMIATARISDRTILARLVFKGMVLMTMISALLELAFTVHVSGYFASKPCFSFR
jgi:hypothetical protein